MIIYGSQLIMELHAGRSRHGVFSITAYSDVRTRKLCRYCAEEAYTGEARLCFIVDVGQ